VLEHPVIVDAGPLVALLVANDAHHRWAVTQFQKLPAPLFTCEPVLTEVFHLVARRPNGLEGFFALLTGGALEIDFSAMRERASLHKLIRKYRNLPMSLADACLVRMSEMIERSVIITTDAHFQIYRKHGRQQIQTIMPTGEA
jgi:uncharacterized protein